MVRCNIVVIACLFFLHQNLRAQKTLLPKETLIQSTHSTHISRISKDSLIVISGSTYSFTVDTPEDQGLVATTPTVQQLISQIKSADGSAQQYRVTNSDGTVKANGILASGDRFLVSSQDGNRSKIYFIGTTPMALSGRLSLEHDSITINSKKNLIIYFTAGQRTPDATVKIYLPPGIHSNLNNTTVNVIGRGDVLLRDLDKQSIGRTGNKYSYSKVGTVTIEKAPNGGSILVIQHLDLRPANGPDLKIVISDVKLNKVGAYNIKANYTTTQPEKLESGTSTAGFVAINNIADLSKEPNKSLRYLETADHYTKLKLTWSPINANSMQLMQSVDNGKSWTNSTADVNVKNGSAIISGLSPNKQFLFRLNIRDGQHKGYSNVVHHYSGKLDLKSFGVVADGKTDNTDKINKAIDQLHHEGGGVLLFSDGIYNVRTVHLKSNVWLYIDKGAIIKAIKGADAPESTWFSDKKYRSGLSPTDDGPYANPENWLTKQDVGHHYFRNTMFFGERLDNVKIIGNGLITGDGNLVTGDRVMNNAPDNRADKMFTLKLCTNLEIGGIYRSEDLWYDSARDEPYYITNTGGRDFNTENMLKIEQGGHFVLLATGTDNINVHDTYFAKYNSSNARDIYDFMQCNNVTVTNIYSKVSSDDIVKPGSDCSLGFTRPARNHKVRNIIGDTNCNLFQIGSETADDIQDIHVDNIYVLGANKAGFSISTNDGAHIKDIHLNCGHTGTIHSRSKMYRAYAPFFISISNRGRILGASVARYKFDENGIKHDELLVTNVNIGIVENILINGIDVAEVYAGSSHSDKNVRWKPFTDQRRATPIIAGYKLPESSVVEGGLKFTLPNGKHTGYIKNVVFNDVHVLVKGGNPASDTSYIPPELGVGQYNASNLKLQPSYGLWARHVMGLTVTNCSFNYEKPDGRYAIYLDDVLDTRFEQIKVVGQKNRYEFVKLNNGSTIQR